MRDILLINEQNTQHMYLGEIFVFLAIFFSELAPALTAIGFLILADTLTGIWGVVRNNGWNAVTSRKAGRIVAKLIIYPLCIIVAKVSEKYLTPIIPWTDVTLGILATVEIKSIFENASIILGFNLWEKVRKVLWKDKVDDEEPKKDLV